MGKLCGIFHKYESLRSDFGLQHMKTKNTFRVPSAIKHNQLFFELFVSPQSNLIQEDDLFKAKCGHHRLRPCRLKLCIGSAPTVHSSHGVRVSSGSTQYRSSSHAIIKCITQSWSSRALSNSKRQRLQF